MIEMRRRKKMGNGSELNLKENKRSQTKIANKVGGPTMEETQTMFKYERAKGGGSSERHVLFTKRNGKSKSQVVKRSQESTTV